jgi:succinate dehydrogenase/fumarate reductase flavoprotein subunit
MMEHRYDVVIVGAGLAGLRAAIELGEDTRVAIITKVFATRSHSGAAQGGIGAAIGNEEKDDWQWHMFDTVKGSDYLGDQDAIEIMARDAPRVVYELEHLGVPDICQDIVYQSLEANYAKTSFTFESENRDPPKGSRNQRRRSIHHPERVQASEEKCLSQL